MKRAKSSKPPKVKSSVVNAATARGAIALSPKKTLLHRVTVKNAAAVGGIVPINLKVGRNFGKSDKVMIHAECCGPYRQKCPPPGIKGTA